MSIVASAIWHVAPSCWNHMSSTSISFILGQKKSVIMGVGPNPDAKFAKLKTAKGRVLVHGEELTSSGSPAHFHGPRKCSRPIWRSFDVRMLADCLPNRSSPIWPPNVGESTLKGHRVCRKMGATFALMKFHHLDVLLNRVTCHGDFASVTEY